MVWNKIIWVKLSWSFIFLCSSIGSIFVVLLFFIFGYSLLGICLYIFVFIFLTLILALFLSPTFFDQTVLISKKINMKRQDWIRNTQNWLLRWNFFQSLVDKWAEYRLKDDEELKWAHHINFQLEKYAPDWWVVGDISKIKWSWD